MLLLLLLLPTPLNSIIIGSNTTPSREAFVTFPAADSNNMINGFASMENGFALQSALATCTYNSTFPVSGTVNLAGGNIYLLKDFLFDNGVTVNSFGSLYGNGHNVECAATTTAISGVNATATVTFNNVNFCLHNNVSWYMPVSVSGSCTIDGDGGLLTFVNNGKFLLTAGAALTFNNVKLVGCKTGVFLCAADNSSITLRNSSICLSDDFLFSRGSILFTGDVKISGTKQFSYSSYSSSTIASQSKLYVAPGVTFCYAPMIPNRDLLYMTDKTSQLYLDGCSLYSTVTGMRLTRGTLLLDNGITFSSPRTKDSEAISFGNGVAAEDLDIIMLGGVKLNVYGAFHYNNTI